MSYEWGKTGDKHGIHIQARPLETLAQDCEDDSAKAVMNHLFDLAKRWLDYDASHPIQVLSPFKCEGDEAWTHHDQMENPGDFCVELFFISFADTGNIYSRSRSLTDSLAVADACGRALSGVHFRARGPYTRSTLHAMGGR